MKRVSPRHLRRAIALFAGVFGLLTVLAGGSVVLRLGQAADLAGAVVPFVVWFNVAAGFAYLVAAVWIWTGWRAAPFIAGGIAAATAAVALAFGVAVLSGQAYEMRTVGALALRFLVWAAIATWSWRQRPA